MEDGIAAAAAAKSFCGASWLTPLLMKTPPHAFLANKNNETQT